MYHYLLLLGSNLGNTSSYIDISTRFIEKRIGSISQLSEKYTSRAWGVEDQPDFLNQALILETADHPLKVLEMLKEIEIDTGRQKTYTWGPREIDIDILACGAEIFCFSHLVIPHPFFHVREFALKPALDIWPAWKHPVFGKTIAEMLENLKAS